MTDNLDRILRSVAFIEEHLNNPPGLKEIAEQACFSEYHFHRLFHLLVGDPPGEYIRKRRLYEAALLLKATGKKIIDVACEYGYQSPEAFSRAFTKHFGINPADVKKNKSILIRYPRPVLTRESLDHIHSETEMKPRIVSKDEMKFVGPVYYGDNKNGEISSFWERHFGAVVDLPLRIGDGCFGICFHTRDYEEQGLFHYMPAVEVAGFERIPPEAVGKIIPAHRYAVFTHKGAVTTLMETYRYIFGTWLPDRKYEPDSSFDFEYYTKDRQGNDIVEIHIPVNEKSNEKAD